MYDQFMSKLWSETIEAHRHDVREAILAATWQLVIENGVLAVTMSQVAASAGVGRATLYKYFPDVESILGAYHDRHVADHLEGLERIRDETDDPTARLEAVLETYALICHHRAQHGTPELGALLHRGDNAAAAKQQLVDLIRDTLEGLANSGELRPDAPIGELAFYCFYALQAAGSLTSEEAVRRLVTVTIAGLKP